MLNVTKSGDTKSDLYAWLGMLGPPTVWIINFEVIYAGVLPACKMQSKTMLFLSCLVCLLLIGGCAFLATREVGSGDAHKTRRFMGRVGLMSSGLFILVTVAQTIAVLLLDACSM
jgi:hypothetical protein